VRRPLVGGMFVAGGLLAGAWFTSRLRGLPAAGSEPLPPISVVIPARDEATSLPLLLESLALQASVLHEVIVVDDASTDATADVAAAFGARVVRLAGLPAGWAGKPHACAQGAAVATGDLLLFLDADVRLLPGAVARLAAVHAERGGLISVQPYHRIERRYEELSAMCNAVSMIGSGAFARAPRQPRRPVAFGPCLLTSKRDYDVVGGHTAVRDDVVEDIALAGEYRRAGLGVDCRIGAGAVEFRMYPGGVGQLVEGWTKNMAAGAGSADPVAVIAGAWFVAACATAAMQACRVIGRRGTTTRSDVVGVATMWMAAAVALRSILFRIGSFRTLTAVAHPVATAAFVGIFVRSVWSTVVRRRVRWRGRLIPVGRMRTD